jgi:SNF2 family DNA or RNA helicase
MYVMAWESSEARATAEWCKARGSDTPIDVAIREEPLPVLLMNIEAVLTELGEKTLLKLLTKRTCLWIEDESSDISNPGAKRTKRLTALGRRAAYRRILDGNPTDEKPLDLFAPIRWLSPTILGITQWSVFKDRYAEWIEQDFGHVDREGRPKLTRTIKKVYRDGLLRPVYKNLDDLARRIGPHAFMLTSAEEEIGLPEFAYGTAYVRMIPAQQRMYDELKEEYATTFDGDGASVSAANTLVRDLRLQQIALGYVPVDPSWMWKETTPEAIEAELPEPTRVIPGAQSPRADLLLNLMAKYPGKKIVWCRFRMDIDYLMTRLREAGITAARFDGSVSPEERDDLKTRFQEDPTLEVLVANGRVGGRGITLTAGRTVFFYSNYQSARLREQMERRTRRIGQTGMISCTDILTYDSVDVKNYKRLLGKREDAKEINAMIAAEGAR